MNRIKTLAGFSCGYKISLLSSVRCTLSSVISRLKPLVNACRVYIFSMRPPSLITRHFMESLQSRQRLKISSSTNGLSEKYSTIKYYFISKRNLPGCVYIAPKFVFFSIHPKRSHRCFTVSYQRGQQPYDLSYNSRFHFTKCL